MVENLEGLQILKSSVPEFVKPLLVDTNASHDFHHLQEVADRSVEIGGILKVRPAIVLVSYGASMVHDVVKTLRAAGNDAEKSATVFGDLAKWLKGNHTFIYSDEEVKWGNFAIANHGKYRPWLEDPVLRERWMEQSGEEVCALVVNAADKITANGKRAIERRAAYVSGDQIAEGYLGKDFGFMLSAPGHEDKGDEVEAFVAESFIRMTWINPDWIYPRVLREFLIPYYETQRECVAGACVSLGIDTQGVADLLFNTRSLDGKSNLLEVRQKVLGKRFNSVDEVHRDIVGKSGVTDEMINNTSRECAEAARLAVLHFSGSRKLSIDEAERLWIPVNRYDRKWKASA